MNKVQVHRFSKTLQVISEIGVYYKSKYFIQIYSTSDFIPPQLI
jgi:hypothetical protein